MNNFKDQFTNRVNKYYLKDKRANEIYDTDFLYDVVFGNKSTEIINKLANKENPILKIDINGDEVRFYIDSELSMWIKYLKGNVEITEGKRTITRKIAAICFDAYIRKVIYDLLSDYNIKKIEHYAILFEGIKVDDFLHIPFELDVQIYNKGMTKVTQQGERLINNIKVISNTFGSYMKNGELTKEADKSLRDHGLYNQFQEFLSQLY